MRQLKLIIAALFLVSPFAANADIIVDQDNSLTADGLGFCHISSNDCGQSFQQDADNIAGAGIFLGTQWAGSGNITISIWEQYAGGLSGLVASGTSGVVNQTSGWVDIFWDSVAIAPLTTYYMVLSSTENNLVANYSNGYIISLDSYASGVVLYRGSEYPSSYDLAFRTYTDDMVSVPEPGTLALLGLGLAGMGLARRRRKV